MTETIHVKGLDKLIGKLDTIAKLRVVKAGIKAGGLHIKGKIAKYPPATAANFPGPYPKRWYQRGWGSKYARLSGGVGGRMTSETLRAKWTIQSRDAGMSVVIGNNVTYSVFVQSAEKQAAFHKRHGWKTDKQVVEKEGPKVKELIARAIRRSLAA